MTTQVPQRLKQQKHCKKCSTPLKGNLDYDALGTAENAIFCSNCGDIKKIIPT